MKSIVALLLLIWPVFAVAQDRTFTLSAPQEVQDTGFLQYLLPRFALKFGLRITQVENCADAVIGSDGTPVFAGLGQTWSLSHNGADGPQKFEDWLRSDIGRRTIDGFAPDGVSVFTSETSVAVEVPEPSFAGDAVAGEALALQHCGRCHVINDTNRMKGMGQTPSFALMRTFDDWQVRFAAFFTLNPHPSFTQIDGSTHPFGSNRPPAIVPVEMTQAEHEAILAYVATIPPADLGAPLQSQ